MTLMYLLLGTVTFALLFALTAAVGRWEQGK